MFSWFSRVCTNNYNFVRRFTLNCLNIFTADGKKKENEKKNQIIKKKTKKKQER